jgi:hypothetical protein
MDSIRIPSDVVSSAGRATHDLALGALVGGNLFGRVAMNTALEDVSDKAERGKVLNRAWRRYGTVNSLALVALMSGWLPARLGEASPRWLSPRERRLATAKDIAVGTVVVTGLASAASGVSFAQQAPGGAVPMASGHDAAPETPAKAARLKRLVNALGALNLASELALVAINASLSQTNFRRPPARRLLRRRY